MHERRTDALQAIRTAVEHKFNRGGANGMAPARAHNAPAERILSEPELTALRADYRMVNNALEASDTTLVSDVDTLILAERHTQVYLVDVFDPEDNLRGQGKVTDAASAGNLIQSIAGNNVSIARWIAKTPDGQTVSYTPGVRKA